MIVRILSESQYRVDGAVLEQLKALDEKISTEVAEGDEVGFHSTLAEILSLVRSKGSRLADAELVESDLILPQADMTLREAQQLFHV